MVTHYSDQVCPELRACVHRKVGLLEPALKMRFPRLRAEEESRIRQTL